MHPRSKHWHLIDYVIIRKRDRQDMRVTKAMCGTECWTDHRLIVSKLKIRVQPKRRRQGMKTPRRLNTSKLKVSNIKQSFVDTLEARLESTVTNDHDMEAARAKIREMVYAIAMDCQGPTARKHKDWFDENYTEIQQLLVEKVCGYRAHIDDPMSTAKKDALRNVHNNIQCKLRQLQDTRLSNKADEIQGFADRNDTKSFYNGLKEVYGPTASGAFSLRSADGSTLITDREKILDINNDAIDRLPQVPIHETLDAPPTLEETQKAIHLLSNGKAPGADAIPAEVFKEGGAALVEKLHQLFQLIWQHETVPQDFKDATILHLYKRKGTVRPVTTTMESPCFLLKARFWQEFC